MISTVWLPNVRCYISLFAISIHIWEYFKNFGIDSVELLTQVKIYNC